MCSLNLAYGEEKKPTGDIVVKLMQYMVGDLYKFKHCLLPVMVFGLQENNVTTSLPLLPMIRGCLIQATKHRFLFCKSVGRVVQIYV